MRKVYIFENILIIKIIIPTKKYLLTYYNPFRKKLTIFFILNNSYCSLRTFLNHV